MPLCNPYRVQDTGSARSRGNDWRVCRGMREHAPMLTSSVGRRGASLAGLLASCFYDAAHEVEVARSSRRCLLLSRPSFLIIARPSGTLRCSYGRPRHLNRHRARHSQQVGEAGLGSRSRAGMAGADSHHFIGHADGLLSRLGSSLRARGAQVSRKKSRRGHDEPGAVDGKTQLRPKIF